MKRTNKISRFTHDKLFRSKITLTFTLIWSLILAVYYFLAGYFILKSEARFFWSWYFSLSIWYVVIALFRAILEFNIHRLKDPNKIDFDLIIIVFLFINLFETLLITITPTFFTEMFGSKLNAPITITSLVINSINIVLFILSFVPVKKDKFNNNEANFLRCKNIIGRMSGLFNILIITINILIYLQVNNKYISYAYVGIGSAFSLMSLILAIYYINKRRK